MTSDGAFRIEYPELNTMYWVEMGEVSAIGIFDGSKGEFDFKAHVHTEDPSASIKDEN